MTYHPSTLENMEIFREGRVLTDALDEGPVFLSE
jgi:hypothetical protein